MDSAGESVKYEKAVVLSTGIRRIPNLLAFLPEVRQVKPLWITIKKTADSVIGWGHKRTAQRARALAAKLEIQYIALEDGFLRSLLLGRDGDPPVSLIVDHEGVYYDAGKPSQLEKWLECGDWTDKKLTERAERIRLWLISERLSKYNNAPDKHLWRGEDRERVLVVDQTFGDMSVIGGMADEKAFQDMLQAALRENPEAEVVVRTHPDVVAGYRKGYLGSLPEHPRLTLLTDKVSPWSVLDKVHTVYTATSQLGFEALLAGKQVRCFGMPFYAGWGLTKDEVTCPRRTRKPTVEEVFAAAYLKYARYVDPITGKRCEIEQIIPLLADRRRNYLLTEGDDIVCSGVSRWKKQFLPSFLSQTRRKVCFAGNTERAIEKAARKKGRLVIWASRETSEIRNRAAAANVPVIRVEDAFLRSVGLGSDLVRPLSLVLDDEGIYYDCSRPSRLETLLRETDFSPFLLDRARKVRECILQHGLTKYNVGGAEAIELPRDGRRLVLVPGQVEDDASILRGSPHIRHNSSLLQQVRKACPEAYVLFKPHPDVVVSNRRGAVSEGEARQWCDAVITNMSMDALLAEVDEVHTMTSLSGFEALLREKKVVCYGLPFYAGWGLTEDRLICERRGRQLTLDELVAAALILYPTCVDPVSGQVCTVEHLLDWLGENKFKVQGPPLKTRLIRLFQYWRQVR